MKRFKTKTPKYENCLCMQNTGFECQGSQRRRVGAVSVKAGDGSEFLITESPND